MRRRKPHEQTLTGMIERILALVEQIAREAGISPKPERPPVPTSSHAPPPEAPKAGEPTMDLLEP